MRSGIGFLLAILMLAAPAWGQQRRRPHAVHAAAVKLPPGLYATFITSRGTFVVQLYPQQAPKTVHSFVELAEGKRPFRDPLTGMLETRPFYDGLLFYRIISGQIIQTGDPSNTGGGSVGFQIPAESDSLKFDRAGRLGMAQAGDDPSSRSTEIFISLVPNPQLDRAHFIVFGQVVEGLPVVRAIADAPHRGEHPLHAVTIRKVVISQR